MYCMMCGKQIPDNSTFCCYCGAKVAISNHADSAQNEPKESVYRQEQQTETERDNVAPSRSSSPDSGYQKPVKKKSKFKSMMKTLVIAGLAFAIAYVFTRYRQSGNFDFLRIDEWTSKVQSVFQKEEDAVSWENKGDKLMHYPVESKPDEEVFMRELDWNIAGLGEEVQTPCYYFKDDVVFEFWDSPDPAKRKYYVDFLNEQGKVEYFISYLWDYNEEGELNLIVRTLQFNGYDSQGRKIIDRTMKDSMNCITAFTSHVVEELDYTLDDTEMITNIMHVENGREENAILEYSNGKVVKTSYSNGDSTSYEYSEEGNIIRQVQRDASGNQTIYLYSGEKKGPNESGCNSHSEGVNSDGTTTWSVNSLGVWLPWNGSMYPDSYDLNLMDEATFDNMRSELVNFETILGVGGFDVYGEYFF